MKKQNFVFLVAATVGACFLSACGGGDAAAPSVVPGMSVPTAFTLNGTAATGAAISGGNVTANCVVGTASGTTDADGSFALTLDKGQIAPCLLRVTKAVVPPAAAVELYGFAAAAGRVNITTLTDTALNRALATSPGDVFASFDAARAAAINSALPAAISYMQAQFSASNLGAVPANLMTVNFAVGDVYDKLLDNMAVALLSAGKTYADFIAVAKRAGDLVTVTTPLPITAGEITVSPAILAQPLTGKLTYLQTAADTAGFAGSHVYGRGFRSNVSTAANPFITFSSANITDCKLNVDGANLVLSAGGQIVSVPLTPTVFPVLSSSTTNLTIGNPSSINITVYPRNLYGNTSFVSFAGPVNAAFKQDGILLNIANGVVTDVIANDAATDTQTTCGGATGGNLNTDRSLDALTLPTALVANLKAASIAKGAYTQINQSVSAADLSGLAVGVNFGRGVFTTVNPDATIKDVMRINDCKTEVSAGKLRLSSVQAGYDKTILLSFADYAFSAGATAINTNKDLLGFRGNEITTPVIQDVILSIEIRANTPVITGVTGKTAVAGGNTTYMICPRG